MTLALTLALMKYDGFLPFSRASFMMDFVAVALVGILILLGLGIAAVKYRRNYTLHKRLQWALSLVLGVTVAGFEIDVRYNGWEEAAKPSPHWDTLVFPALYIHLFFAISAVMVWVVTLVGAGKHFQDPPRPSSYSVRHMQMGKAAAVLLVMTAITGWVFFYLAFVA